MRSLTLRSNGSLSVICGLLIASGMPPTGHRVCKPTFVEDDVYPPEFAVVDPCLLLHGARSNV